jgi:hypothetical protein
MPNDDERLKNFTPRNAEILLETKAVLTEEVHDKGFAFIGPGAERRFKLNRIRFNNIISWLREDGFVTFILELVKPETEDSEMILVKVLAPEGTTYQEAWHQRDKILKLWSDAQRIAS